MSATRHSYVEIVRILLACPTIDVNVAAPVSENRTKLTFSFLSLLIKNNCLSFLSFIFLFFNRQEGRP